MTTPVWRLRLPFPDPKIEKWIMAENDKYTQNKKDVFDEPAHPGRPLEPDELPENPPQFSPQVGARKEQDVHPTSELSSTPTHKAGPIRPSGKHPTAELHIKPGGRK